MATEATVSFVGFNGMVSRPQPSQEPEEPEAQSDLSSEPGSLASSSGSNFGEQESELEPESDSDSSDSSLGFSLFDTARDLRNVDMRDFPWAPLEALRARRTRQDSLIREQIIRACK